MNKPKSTPPKWADRFLAWFCSDDLLEEIQGDLHEAYYHRVETLGKAKASRLFIVDVFRFFKPYAFEKYSSAKQFLPMYSNYFKIAFRNIIHRKGFTAINLFGLAFGISAVMLIGLFLNNELSYDQATPDHERVYRVMNNYRAQTYTPMQFMNYFQASRDTQIRLVNHLMDYEEVEMACHFVPSESSIGGREKYYVEVDGRRFVVDNALYTNTGKNFQAIFPQRFLKGSPESAFSNYNKIVLTKNLAENWFGPTWESEELIGKTLTIRDEVFELGGVIANVPGNIHFNFDFIVHQETIPSWAAYTYLKLSQGASIDDLLAKINNEVDVVYPGYTEDVLSKGIIAVALTDIHFTDDTLYELKPVANKTYLLTFGIVGFIILLIIWTNYTNLSVAMYADRQKELGIRKVMGARPQDISFQLLIEAALLALICFPICWLIVRGLLPYFKELMAIELATSIMLNGWTLLALFMLLFVTGIFSGIYPAITYGRRSMLRLFGQKVKQIPGSRYLNFRNVLLTTQFIMVVGLLSITFFIQQQMNFISNKDLGFNKESVVYFSIDGVEKYQQLKTRLSTIPEIESVGANGVPGSEMYNQLTYKMKDTETVLSDGTEQYVDYGLLKTLGIKCEPCKELDAGKKSVFIINQTAADKLARIKKVSTEALVGETLVTEPEWENEEFGNGVPHQVDGIIDDYKFFSLKYPNQSLLLTVVDKPTYAYDMVIRANTNNWGATIYDIQEAYNAVEQVRPFEIAFLEDRLEQLYTDERRSGILLACLSIVAIILALMGLAGIVSYIAFSRQKEIGIRKILGASSGNILFKFNKEFMLLMGLATLIAMPVAIYFSTHWLESFAYHINPSFWVVLMAGLAALILVVILVSIQAGRAANKQPVEVLRAD